MAYKGVPTSSKKKLLHRLDVLQEISVELLKERDPKKLLNLIISRALNLMVGDAGSLYLKDQEDNLIFEVAINHSTKQDLGRLKLPLNSSGIAVYCFNTKTALRVDDVHHLSADAQYTFNGGKDKDLNYRSRTMICHPLMTSQDEVLGVIQIINKKNKGKELWPSHDEAAIAKMPLFNEEDEKLLKSFASLASAALENTGLYKNINNLLEGFVHAAVSAIESRDLSTSGHSERVAVLTTGLAENISSSRDRHLRNISFNDQQLEEIRYASLLHDFGKIGIKENILLKSEKLYPEQKAAIKARLDEFSHVGEINILRRYMDKLAEDNRAPTKFELKKMENNIHNFRQKMNFHWQKILSLNTTSVLQEDNTSILNELKKITFPKRDGDVFPLLEKAELTFLSIKKGSLTERERDEINMHVTHTYEFLKEIPWTKKFSNLVDIAHAHHEKLDGTGYPRGLKGNAIPVQSKIMTIADIFDALVAMDRPYKKAVPIEKALFILEDEVKNGKLDSAFFNVFLEGKIWKKEEFLKHMVQPPRRKKKAA